MSDRTEQTGVTDVGRSAGLQPLSDLGDHEAWAMVESSPDGMILADEHGVMLFVNSQIEVLFGYDRGDLLGRAVEQLLPERYRQQHAAHRTRYRAQPVSRAMGSELDLMGRRCDGTEFPVEVSLSPITSEDGLRVVATVRDISERLAVEAHSHAVLHTIDAAHDGVFMFTADTLQFAYVNQGAQTQLGYSRDDLLEMSPLHVNPEFTEATFRELLRPLLAGDVGSHVFTTVHRRNDGHDIPVEIAVEYPPAAGPGHPRLLVALVRDIRDRLNAEAALRDGEAAVRMLEDRERLARDLHDLVIQRLFAAGMGLQSIHALVEHPIAASRIDDTVTELDSTIAELRSAIFELTHTTKTSATDAISAVVEHATPILGFPPTLTMTGAPQMISGEILKQLLAVLTEALANIAHHAQATAVEVSIATDNNTVQLIAADNGTGINPTAARGHGLDNIDARARHVNGTTTLTTGHNGGTVLTWTAAI